MRTNKIKGAFMPFYKAVLKAGHAGTGYYNDFTVYVYKRSYTEVLNEVKLFPMVKHDINRCMQRIDIIDEKEYLIGILQNAYYHMSSQELEPIRTLDGVIKILKRLDRSCVFKTKEAKELKKFCNKYKQAKDNQKILIEKEYLDWANKLIEEYENEKYNFPKL